MKLHKAYNKEVISLAVTKLASDVHFSARTCKIHRCGRITCVYVHIRSQIPSAFIRRAGVAYLARWQPLIPSGAARARLLCRKPLSPFSQLIILTKFLLFYKSFLTKISATILTKLDRISAVL